MQDAPVSEQVAGAGTGSLVLRNAALLFIAQVITTPFAVLVNAVMGRYIGPAEFGRLYLAQTFCGFGFLAVEWGQALTLPGMIAKDRARAGELLATAAVWRLTAAVVVSVVLAFVATTLGHDTSVTTLLLLVALGATIATLSSACQETIRGFERTDVMAYAQVGGQLLAGTAAIVTLVIGGGLPAVLVVQAACAAIVLIPVARATRSVGVAGYSVRLQTLKELVYGGTPFVLFGLAMALQPNIDALFMAKLVPDEVVGWHAAARRLTGVLVFPANAIIAALYPTLCRLHAENHDEYLRTASSAIRTTTILAVPLALGCFLYPDIGVRIFSRDSFGAAEDNLRILAGFLFLVYFSMPLGCALLAGGKQRAWSTVQVACIAFSVTLDPLLIPWFQERAGNGGLGVCVATLVSELFMVGLGVWLSPRGLFDRKLLRQLGLALAAGGVMFGIARLLGGLTVFVAAPLAMTAYVLCLWFIGGLDKDQIAAFRGIFARKLARRSTG
jgi:O-antigen/teichoic acid export membrane protein